MYLPVFETAVPKGPYRIGNRVGMLYRDVRSSGPIQYEFIFAVFEGGAKTPCYCVTSEGTLLAEELGDGSHFLCEFDKELHRNFGDSNEWADEERFLSKAIQMMKEHFSNS